LHDDKTIYEVTYTGDTTLALVFDEDGFNRTLHHEIIYDGENIAALTKEKLVLDYDSLSPTEDTIIVTDGILVLNRNGDKVWHWTIGDVLDPQDDPEILKSLTDWGHANSLALDSDGNYLISWRNFNEVWKIDKTNGELIWRYGPGQVSDSSQMFYGQHSLHVNRDGEYLLMDNGHKAYRSTSRALGFKYDAESGFEQTLSISLPDSLFTSKMGSVYQFEEDKYLFCSPMSRSLLVTNREGDILWYAKCDFQYYRAYYMDTLVL
jgi:arylsulfate sulfotransferase